MLPITRANEQLFGPCQPGETCAQEAVLPRSQGTNSVRGTWCSEGEAGRHLRTQAGPAGTTPAGQETPSFLPIPLRLERIATQAREYPDMAFTTLAHHSAGEPGRSAMTCGCYAGSIEAFCGSARCIGQLGVDLLWRLRRHRVYGQRQGRGNGPIETCRV